MDRLLVVASDNGIPEDTLQALRLAGWRITLTADVGSAKRFLQEGNIATVMVDLTAELAPERLKILGFVRELSPNTMVIMLQPGSNAAVHAAGRRLVQTQDPIGDTRPQAQRHVSLDQYRLSPAQKRIAQLVAQAYPNREIARRIKITEQSVRNQLSKIFRKMGIWNRVELALLLREDESAAEQSTKEPGQAEFQPGLAAGRDRPPITV